MATAATNQNDLMISTTGKARRWWKFTVTGISGSKAVGIGLSGLLTLDYAAHRTGGSGIITGIKIVEKIPSGSFGSGDIRAFIANKSFTAAIGSSLTFPDGDSDHLILSESVTGTYYKVDATKQFTRVKDLDCEFDADTNDSSLYMALYVNASGGITFATGTELDVWVYVEQDEVA